MVTAETAVVIPFGVLMVVAALWVITLGLTQVRLVDASREGARLVARGDAVATAMASARRSAPEGMRLRVAAADGLVTVDARVKVAAPLPMLPSLGLHARSVATDERP